MNKLTVVLPVYNGEKYLSETIDSVLSQTYKEFDFIIIDDCSTDNSVSIILSKNDSRISFVQNEKNLGAVATPEKGMAAAKTKYIARIDQDDIWLPQKLEKQIEILEANPQIGICGTSIELFGDRTGIKIFPEENEALKVGLMFFCCMSHPSVIFRRDFLTVSGVSYNREYSLADDYKMWIDCIDKTQFYVIPEPLVKYRQHPDQICNKQNEIAQHEVTKKIQLEMLNRICGDIPEADKNFHINEFVVGKIKKHEDCIKFINWADYLEQLNNKSQYVNPRIFHTEIKKHLNVFIKRYIVSKYFQKKGISSCLRYIFSMEWRFLPIKKNIGILWKNYHD